MTHTLQVGDILGAPGSWSSIYCTVVRIEDDIAIAEQTIHRSTGIDIKELRFPVAFTDGKTDLDWPKGKWQR